MADQKVMRCHFNKLGEVSPGDILQCPACRWKFVLLPGMVQDEYEDFHIPGYYTIKGQAVACPKCLLRTDLSYYKQLSLTGGIELTNWGKNDETKEVKPDGQPGPRAGVSKQRTRKPDGDQTNKKKTRSPRSKSP